MKKKEEPSKRLSQAKEKAAKMKVVKERLEEIFYSFEHPNENEMDSDEDEVSSFINLITPWQHITRGTKDFDKVYEAVMMSFAVGYVVGQMLDLPDIDTTPIVEAMMDRKALLYFLHRKKERRAA